MPTFDGQDWAGFISQFEACVEYYRWTTKTKTIRLYTSIVGDARKSLGTVQARSWEFEKLKRHLEVRYGRSYVFAQIQAELFAKTMKTHQNIHAYLDELMAIANTGNIPAARQQELVYTAFIYGLRPNEHMYRWVTQREQEGTIESAVELAEAYEMEHGSGPIRPRGLAQLDSRDSTGNDMAIAAVDCDARSDAPAPSWEKQLLSKFDKMATGVHEQLSSIDDRLKDCEQYQADTTKRWKERMARNKKRKQERRDQQDRDDGGRGSDKRKSQQSADVNARAETSDE